jgi:hypothetical protein
MSGLETRTLALQPQEFVAVMKAGRGTEGAV